MAGIDYEKIIKRSWELTKKNKWLWVYGMVFAAFSGSGLRGGGGGSSTKEKIPEDLPEKASQVLGQTTNLIKDWFQQINPSVWILLVLGMALFFLFAIAISWIIKSWAKGALIAGLEEADKNKPVTLLNTSPQGIKAIKHLIIFGFISLGIFLGVILATATIIGVCLLAFKVFPTLETILTIFLVIGTIIGTFTLIFLLLIFSMVSIYAERLIVLKNYSPWQAWKKGLSLSYRNFLPTILMKIINGAIGCSAGCLSIFVLLLVFGIPALILITPIFKGSFEEAGMPVFNPPGLATIIALVVLFISFIYLNILIRGILLVFNFGVWNLFFKQIMSLKTKEKNEK